MDYGGAGVGWAGPWGWTMEEAGGGRCGGAGSGLGCRGGGEVPQCRIWGAGAWGGLRLVCRGLRYRGAEFRGAAPRRHAGVWAWGYRKETEVRSGWLGGGTLPPGHWGTKRGGNRGELWLVGKASARRVAQQPTVWTPGARETRPPACGSRVWGVCPVVLLEGCPPQGAGVLLTPRDTNVQGPGLGHCRGTGGEQPLPEGRGPWSPSRPVPEHPPGPGPSQKPQVEPAFRDSEPLSLSFSFLCRNKGFS